MAGREFVKSQSGSGLLVPDTRLVSPRPPKPIKPLWEVVERGGKRGLKYNLHAGQQAAWESLSRFIAMLAGSQGGKTSFGPLWLHREITRCGPGDYLAVTATYDLFKLKMLPEIINFFERTLRLGTYQASDRVFQFKKEPTRIILRSAQSPESLESATAKAAWCDECGQDQFRLEAWEAILRRLALHQGRALLGTTLYNLGWLRAKVYNPWKAGDKDFDVIQFDSIMNPAFPKAEYRRAKRTMPKWKFAMFYQGRYDRPAGLIYNDYVDAPKAEGGHLVKRFPIPPSWRRHVGVDFGGVNTAGIFIAEDPDTGFLYLYDEYLEGERTSAQHARNFFNRCIGTNLQSAFGGAKNEGQARMDWTSAGFPLAEPVIRDVEIGIDHVIGLFKTSRLFIFDDLERIRDELGTYKRKVDALGQVLEVIQDKETFHLLDALRYCVQGITVALPDLDDDELYVAEPVFISPF